MPPGGRLKPTSESRRRRHSLGKMQNDPNKREASHFIEDASWHNSKLVRRTQEESKKRRARALYKWNR